MALIVSIAMVISTLLGGLFAIRFKDKIHLILGFSAGAVIGMAFFDLLPESIELTRGSYEINFVTMLMAVGFTIYLVIDRFFESHQQHRTFGTTTMTILGILVLYVVIRLAG